MTTTPMREQYLALKKQYPDIVLLFRLGDFYETFDDDARIVSSVCDVVLTSRPVGNDQRVPLAGVPYHAVDTYVARLINAGYKVAIAEQIGTEPPKGEKIVPRVVRRVVTPGTLVEPGLLPEKRNNYLAALVLDGERAGLAYADITTGEFAATLINWDAENDADGVAGGPKVAAGASGADRLFPRLLEELGRLAPAEILFPAQDPRWANRPIAPDAAKPGDGSKRGAAVAPAGGALPSALTRAYHVTPYALWRFDESTARQALLDHFEVMSLAGFGCEGKPPVVRAAGALIQYLQETQKDALAQLTGLRTYSTDEFMTLDEATRRNLELTESLRAGVNAGRAGGAAGSLLAVLDATLTPMGGRLLRRRLSQPLLDVDALNRRLDAVAAWHADAPLRAELRQSLRGLGDLERWTNRAVQGVALPRELVGLREALGRIAAIRELVQRLGRDNSGRVAEGGTFAGALTGALADIKGGLDPCTDLAGLLHDAIADEPPATLATAGVIRPGFSAELDGIHLATKDARAWIANLETVERGRTGIKSLKVGYNKVFGYYIEVTQANAALVPVDYIRKQTLVNAERYITPELKEYESLVLNAAERVLELEGQIFRRVLSQIAGASRRLLATANTIAELDVAAALAEVAESNRYVRPTLADNAVIEIKEGRHPVVERMLADGAQYTPNDVDLSPEQCIVVLTGPNMSGKSTYLRQTALIVLMAQIGSFVPAASAHIGLVDRIFTRIGASDEIARGQSTFMVEMVETANILHHATPRSLLILDEIGRGTSTYDGLAIAWAVVEYIHNHPRLRAKTLFATHYHELTDLAERLPNVVNYNVAVAEQGDDVVFLHRIVPGGADRSYGVHVAQMAGLPRPVVGRAEEILHELEASGAAGPRRSAAPPALYQLSLFTADDPVLTDLRALDVNALSPLDALNKLYELQQRAKAAKGEDGKRKGRKPAGTETNQ
jgi:DNA mismatch repair protein MutS